MHMLATYQIKKLPSMGWIENRRSGLWCQSRSKHSIFVSRESGAWPMAGPESVASELIDVVALEHVTDRSHKVNNYNNSWEYLQKKGDLCSNCNISPTAI